ncbi:hypothetical protein [Dyadobacter psychrotolerans]|uniref:Uncharacterized protein n=1 Tax=Dyadobacter psychrotolerans TaxID=2541721 RepID=A0A4R5DAV3_9BACT|nr:hypothetical protein [Dyadobacter psychrotolerans]TDE10749.1 hypothetical protein E0F88_27125 [Dyadobacter psychrotolerans]
MNIFISNDMDEDTDQPKTSLTKNGSTEEKDAQGSEVARKSVWSSQTTLTGNDSEATEEVRRAVAEYNNNLFWNMRY